MKKRSIHFIKIFSAIILFCAPCALCLFLLREQLPENVLLYSYSRALWLITPVAGISAAVALKGRDAPDEDVIDDDGEYDSFSDTPEDLAGGEKFIEEYSELYRNCDNDNEPVRSVPDIATAISAQKSVICDESSADRDEDERDRIWNEFISDKSEDNTDISSIYDNIPDTLPEGFSFNENDEEDNCYDSISEESDNEYTVRSHRTAIRISAAFICAVCILSGALLSRVYVADTADGVTVGKLFEKENYRWSDTKTIEISPDIMGDGLRIRAHMNDGREYTLCSGLMLRGSAAAEHYISEAEMYDEICEKATNAGAAVNISDRKTIESNFKDTEDWEYISHIIDKTN